MTGVGSPSTQKNSIFGKITARIIAPKAILHKSMFKINLILKSWSVPDFPFHELDNLYMTQHTLRVDHRHDRPALD